MSKHAQAIEFGSIEDMLAASASGVRAPERLTVAEAAERYRYLNNPGSYVGAWNNDFAPYLVEPMEVLTSVDYTGMIFAGPARTGKSDMFFNWLAYTAKCDPADMMVVHMTTNVARDWSKKDLKRMLRHSKKIGALVAPGASSISTHDIRFMSGMHLLVKWPTVTELSGKTVPRNWLADYDRMPLSIDGEGSAYMLTAKRAETFRRYGMTVAESSPGFEITDPKWMPSRANSHEAPPTLGILSLYNGGDRRRWYWRCPHCRSPFEPDFKLLQIPDSNDHVEAAEATVMACPHCGGVIWHDGKNGVPGKHELNQIKLGNARWVKDGQIWVPRQKDGATIEGHLEGTAFRSDTASFWLKGPAANFADWRSIVLKYLKAQDEYERTGSQESLKTTVNTDQGLPFRPHGLQEGRLAEDVQAMATDLGVRKVPTGVRFLVATVDVQKYSFEVLVVGVGPSPDMLGTEYTVIDRFSIKKSMRKDDDGDPERIAPATYLEDWDVLVEQVMLRSYPLIDGSGREMSIRRSGCDSGGAADTDNDSSVTKNIYAFYRRLRNATQGDDIPEGLHQRFQPLKGDPLKSIPRVQLTYPDSERKDRTAGARGEIPVLRINSNAMKDMLNAMLDRKAAGAGKVNFPDWLPDTFWREMVAEERGTKGWEKVSTRNEAWDLLTYAMALCLQKPIAIENIDWNDPPVWACEWEFNSLVFDPEEKKSAIVDAVEQQFNLEDLGAELA